MAKRITSAKDLIDIEHWPNMLVSTDGWFKGPDGLDYKHVWGPVNIVRADALLRFKPSNSANWYLTVGHANSNQVVIAGCQVHYAVMAPRRPTNMNNVLDMSVRR